MRNSEQRFYSMLQLLADVRVSSKGARTSLLENFRFNHCSIKYLLRLIHVHMHALSRTVQTLGSGPSSALQCWRTRPRVLPEARWTERNLPLTAIRFTHACIYMCVYMYIFVSVSVCLYMYKCVYLHIQTSVYVYVYAHMCTYMCKL